MEMAVARGIAAQCWCDPETETREMDVALAEAFAKRLVQLDARDPEIMSIGS